MRFILALLASLTFATVAAAQSAAPQPVAFTDVTVIAVAEGVAEPGRTVIVTGDRIAAVGDVAEVKIPSGATIIDGSGKFLIPGLWDMHVHTGSDRNAREIVYPLYIAHGVTGIRNMKGDCLEPCPRLQSTIMDVKARRQDVVTRKLVGPREVASSAFADGVRDSGLPTG